MKRRRMLLALPVVAGAAMSRSATLAQDPEPEYSPEGAWFAVALIGGLQFPYMDNYTSDSNSQARSGTVLCTLSVSRFPTPIGLVGMTPTGHGSWLRLSKNKFAFTVLRILFDADGRPFGKAKFWGDLTLEAGHMFTGTMNIVFYRQDGTAFFNIAGTISATRIPVEIPQP
jgi:hypothetical protein